MNFTLLTPHYLLLLLVMPAIIWLFWRSTIHLSPFRRGLVLGLRVLIVALLVFSLCGLSVENPTKQVNVMFALDVSDSVGEEGREAALDFLQRALRQMKKGDQGGLVVFGADASVEASLQPAPEVKNVASTVSGQATDIGHALELAMGQFSPAGKGRVVLLTDGNETKGSAQETALVAQSLGVEVWSVPIGTANRPLDVRVERVLVPNHVSVGEALEVRIVVSSPQATPAQLLLFRNQTAVGEREVALQRGKNSFVLPDMLEEPGLHRYEAVVNVPTDPVTENNRVIAFTEVMGKAKILLAYGEEGPPAELAQALEVQGLAPELRRWTELPASLGELLTYDAVILDNVPGLGMSLAKMEAIEKYVGRWWRADHAGR